MPVSLTNHPEVGSVWSSLGPAIGGALSTMLSAHYANKAQDQPAQFQAQAPGTGFSTTPTATLGDAAFSGVKAAPVNAGEFQVPQLQFGQTTAQTTNPFMQRFLGQPAPRLW